MVNRTGTGQVGEAVVSGTGSDRPPTTPGSGRGWARGSNQYVKRPGNTASGIGAGVGGLTRAEADVDLSPPAGIDPAVAARQLEDFGISWAPFDVSDIKVSGLERARHRFRAHLPELIWNTAALEGNNFTLPEVRTLLDGVTVGGRKLSDELQILALSEGYRRLDEKVGDGTFGLGKAVSDELHGLVARHESIESGHFRGEGVVTGGGIVSLAGGGRVDGTEHGPGGSLLRQHYATMLDGLTEIEDPRVRALVYFASATRRQFYFDGNKRTARLMMAGELMSNGYDPVSVPFARQLEFHFALDRMFATDDATALLSFLATCSIRN